MVAFFVILTVVILTLLFFKYASLTVQIDKEKSGLSISFFTEEPFIGKM